MLLSEQDAAVLRLLCWCQFIPAEELRGLVTETVLHNLTCLGLIKVHDSSGAFVLTGKGIAFSSSLFCGVIPTVTYSYHAYAIQRRLRLSRLVLTAYRAEVDVFLTDPAGVSVTPSLLLSAITRGRGSNPWGSTRVAAVTHLGERFYALHYVCPGIGRLTLADELAAFHNQTAQFRGVERALIFAGESYANVLSELETVYPASDSRLIYYGDAYRSLHQPVHLLSCDDTGAMQLRIMAQPDYRRRLTLAALKTQYQTSPEEVTVWDAMFQGVPFVLAVDMDLRRIDAAWRVAREQGYSQIAMAALERQAEEVLFERYLDTGRARVFVLKDDALAEVLGEAPRIFAPARTAYLTEKGEVVDAPAFQIRKKIGGCH